jgi:hypothetical protein
MSRPVERPTTRTAALEVEAVLGWARPVDIEEVIDLHRRALREWADALAS